jgi:formate-dependent nitrite reductase membrane component NrfD
MPPTRSPLVSPTQFLIGYQLQREWAWLIAAAFFFGTAGAGTYIVSFAVGFHVGIVASLVIVGVLKAAAHMLFLGKPLRFPFAVLKWRTSWISRGIVAMLVFLVSGLVYAASFPSGSPVSSGVAHAFAWIAAVAAAVIMVYDGFVLRSSRGIPMWNTLLFPAVGLSYSLLGGSTITLALQKLWNENTDRWLEWLQLGLVFVNVGLILAVILTARNRDAATRISVSLLTRGPIAPFFIGLAVGVGIVATLVLIVVSLAGGGTWALVAAGVTDLIGEFFLFFSLLRVGAHPSPRPLSFGFATAGAR